MNLGAGGCSRPLLTPPAPPGHQRHSCTCPSQPNASSQQGQAVTASPRSTASAPAPSPRPLPWGEARPPDEPPKTLLRWLCSIASRQPAGSLPTSPPRLQMQGACEDTARCRVAGSRARGHRRVVLSALRLSRPPAVAAAQAALAAPFTPSPSRSPLCADLFTPYILLSQEPGVTPPRPQGLRPADRSPLLPTLRRGARAS